MVAPQSGVNGLAYVEATINDGFTQSTYRKDFWVGLPGFSIDGDDLLFARETGFAVLNYTSNRVVQGVSSVVWTYTGPLDYVNGDMDDAFYRASSEGGFGYIYALATNVCGSKENRMFFEVEGGFHMLMSPVPASEELNVEIVDPENESTAKASTKGTTTGTESYLVTLVNQYQRVVYSQVHTEKQFSINVSVFPAGIYYLQIKKNDKIYTEKLIISD